MPATMNPVAGPAPSPPPVVLDTRVVTGSGGGPDKTILNSPRFFATRGYRMLCAYMHPPADPGSENIRRRAAIWEAPLDLIPDSGPFDWRVAPCLLRICRREGVSIWHGHDYKSNALGLLLRPFHAMKLVTTVHGWVRHTRRTKLYYGIDRLCLARYDRVLCVSEDLRQRCLDGGVPEARCVLVENGIDTDAYPAALSVEEAKLRLGIPAHRVVVGAVGRLSTEKGFDLLIRSAARLMDGGCEFDLIIAGEGGEESRLRKLADDLGKGGRIRLLGYRSDATEVFRAMDAFVLSSLREGLPNVVMEAMASGIPVLATRIAGIPRLVRDGENGLLIEAGSEGQLSLALGRLVGDPGLRSRLGREGRKTVEASYTFTARIEKVREIYDELLGR